MYISKNIGAISKANEQGFACEKQHYCILLAIVV